MGSSVASHIKASAIFHALSDPTRLEVINRLSAGEQCVCELTDAMQTGQSRLSFHLKVLKDAGLIQDRREGRWMYYALNEEAFEEVEEVIRTFKKSASVGQSAKRRC